MEKSTRGRHGLPRRSRQRGVRMQAQARGRPQPGTALSTSAQERQGRSRSRQAEEQILCASAVLQRTRRTAAWQARNRAQRASFGRGRKKRQDGRFPRQGCGIPDARDKLWTPQQLLRASAARQPHSARRAGQRASPALLPHNTRLGLAQCGADPHPAFEHFQERTCPFPREVRVIPKLRGSRDAPGRCRAQTTPQNRHRGGNNRRRKSRGRDEHNRRRRERKSRRAQTRPGEKQPTPQRTTPSGTATAAARGAHPSMFRRIHPRAFAQTNTTRPALPPPETGHAPCPAHKKRRSAKPKFCRTPDRHGSGLARSLNRTFSYRMKLVRMTGSFSGSGTPAALPASKQRSIHAMFLAS